MSEKKIRILIADDFDIIREVIHLVLKLSDEMEVVGEAPELEEALEETKSLQPDIILMNDYLPPTNSATATRLFRDAGIDTAILIVSMKNEPELIKQSLDSGANGFMHKDEIGEHLIEAVRKVHQSDEKYLSPMARDAVKHD